MARRTLRDAEDIIAFVWGCSLYGTGGGGFHEKGITVLTEQRKAGRELGWVDVDELDDEAWTVCPLGMGSLSPIGEGYEAEMAQFQLGEKKYLNYLTPAVKELMRYTGKQITAIVPSELGGSNTPAPVATAAELGMVAVDGDYMGRAMPEIGQGTVSLAGKPICPIASVDSWGNVAIIDRVVNNAMAERIGKMLAVAAFGATGLATSLLPAKDVKEILLRGTLTQSLEVGRKTRQAYKAGRDPVKAIIEATGGWLLFVGKVSQRRAGIIGGYSVGQHVLSGEGDFAGHEFKIWFKNENHVAWLDGRRLVTTPDLICVVDSDTGRPLLNSSIAIGDRIAVIGIRSRPEFRTPAALKLMNPRHFGFDMDYVPIEEALGGM
ncbi:MAG: DUF917 domain-containing protein [Chloroflexi bacterium]|nr:DUF917 domain-containing protein [Chloroflexota bacterium]